jgi:hypothetical protein
MAMHRARLDVAKAERRAARMELESVKIAALIKPKPPAPKATTLAKPPPAPAKLPPKGDIAPKGAKGGARKIRGTLTNRLMGRKASTAKAKAGAGKGGGQGGGEGGDGGGVGGGVGAETPKESQRDAKDAAAAEIQSASSKLLQALQPEADGACNEGEGASSEGVSGEGVSSEAVSGEGGVALERPAEQAARVEALQA